MSKARRPRRPKPAPAPAPPPAAADQPEQLSGWARLSRGTKTLIALVATTAVAAIVPGAIPWVSDRALDLAGVGLIDIDTAIASSYGYSLASAEVVGTVPENPQKDPRFLPAGRSTTKLMLDSRRAATITLTDVTIEVVERKPPLTGTLYLYEPQGGGPTEHTSVTATLDDGRVAVRDPESKQPYFTGRHVDLTRGELAVVDVETTAKQCECAWRMHLTMRYRGADHDVLVPPADQPPLRMTALADPVAYRLQWVGIDGDTVTKRDCVADRAACAATAKQISG